MYRSIDRFFWDRMNDRSDQSTRASPLVSITCFDISSTRNRSKSRFLDEKIWMDKKWPYLCIILDGMGRIMAAICFNIHRSKRFFSSLHISSEVALALSRNDPVVALESTIITHGMPYPRNFETANLIEQAVRKGGAVPATIAIVRGELKVGLTNAELHELAKLRSQGTPVMKASRRDLAYAVASKANAGTTVASTMILAERAGIKVFATGGIGGVHRGGETTMDISADLVELGRSPICVVSAGIKSILDIARSLEVLETNGVPVIGFGTEVFPAFFTNDSGLKAPLSVSSTRLLAEMIDQSETLGLRSGMLVAVPNPSPASSAEVNLAINEALKSASIDGITGAAITPYILERVEQLSGGRSLDANVALVCNNARVAAEIAVEYTALRRAAIGISQVPATDSIIECVEKLASSSSYAAPSCTSPSYSHSISTPSTPVSVLVFGGAAVDIISTVSVRLAPGTSNPGITRTRYGGVARNIAESLSRLSAAACVKVALVSAVARDRYGMALLDHVASLGVDISRVKVLNIDNTLNSAATATYSAIHAPDGDLFAGVADMGILNALDQTAIADLAGAVRSSNLVVVDGNLGQESFASLANIASTYNVPVLFEPTSDFKCTLPLLTKTLQLIDIIKPNISELVTLVGLCLDMGLITRNKASVTSSLDSLRRYLVRSRESRLPSSSLAEKKDIMTDARVLVCALHIVMTMTTSGGDGGGKGQQLPLRARSLLTSEGIARKVRGKHVLLSLGEGGVLWCASKDIVLQRPQGQKQHSIRSSITSSGDSFSSAAKAIDSSIVTVIDDYIAVKHFPALALPVITERAQRHTSGAGDAFTAGVVAAMISDTCAELDSACVEAGLTAAKKRLEENVLCL